MGTYTKDGVVYEDGVIRLPGAKGKLPAVKPGTGAGAAGEQRLKEKKEKEEKEKEEESRPTPTPRPTPRPTPKDPAAEVKEATGVEATEVKKGEIPDWMKKKTK